ncbi:DUF3667 domain-containing protein [Lysobacter sp. SG-8]|uniref:DUF3667 domain-containing protein n=1 Tax=Marilutibacter penaei TaxID=2759900 RepID=A0A7W3U2F6_9GAMM|nr:DUF3667 domain-containing protein [Lysobacter penaei]MBB1087731.1 DUF3667 domain-containing protein [Lysobacter penaei]
MARHPPEAHPSHCANCNAALQGGFCHACGQSSHDPMRSLGHAIEDIFESFWHLDGRVFRTLRDLMVPGRVANAYLAGHRVRYLPPLRLFVILAALAFFVGALTIRVDVDSAEPMPLSGITGASTVEEVERERDRLLAEVQEARRALHEEFPMPGMDALLITEEVRIQGEAANRIEQLTAKPGDTVPEWEGPLFTPSSEAWSAEKNPVGFAGAPGFVNAWLAKRQAQAERNLASVTQDPSLFLPAVLHAQPTTLFLLAPIFALLLKLAYLGSGRVYLEHMVVALYSHCFLLLALLAVFLLWGLGSMGEGHAWTRVAVALPAFAILAWMPVYLLVMQQRVYRDVLPLTVLKYCIIGSLYFLMAVILATLTSLYFLTQPL